MVDFLPRDAMLSAVYAVVVCLSGCLSVSVCVCLSVTLRYGIKMAKRRITQIMPYDRSRTLVYQYRLESRSYRMALLIALHGPSALAELLLHYGQGPSTLLTSEIGEESVQKNMSS